MFSLLFSDSWLCFRYSQGVYNDPEDGHEIIKKKNKTQVIFSLKEMLTGLLKGKGEVTKSKNFH